MRAVLVSLLNAAEDTPFQPSGASIG